MNDSKLRQYDVEDSNYNEEWYQHYYTCKHCGESFMVDCEKPNFCPNCGHEIDCIKCGMVYEFNLRRKEEEREEHDS